MQAFVITLLQSEVGCEIAKEAVLAANSFGVDASIHPAVLGYDSKPLFDQYGITQFLNYTIMEKPGQQGCFLSHFQLWLKCIELDKPIMILEHDGIMIRPLPDDVLDHFTDVLRLDACVHWKPGYDEGIAAGLQRDIGYERKETECYHPTVGSYYVGAYGYLIKPSGADKLVRFATERGAVCAEAHIATNVVDIINVTSSVVKLHPYYRTDTIQKSTTDNLSLIRQGSNPLSNATYLSPLNYARRYPIPFK